MITLSEVENWYYKALDIPEVSREDYVNTELKDNPKLRTAVLELLRFDNADKGVLTELVEKMNSAVEDSNIPKIERYEVVKKLGSGGMADVYLGRRTDGVFEHRVAIKVLKKGMDTEDIVRRFNLERNLLGRLKHENISQIYDGGVTSDNRPFFAMEFVEGEDLITYCKTNSLSVTEKVKLFQKVCGAVEFAHQNLILHRDIKPSNILVNTRGEVKLTDFGIAKLLDSHEAGMTIPIQRPMTPEYASPEQIRNEDLDIRSDIFQLGLVLRELIKSNSTGALATIASYASNMDRDGRYTNVSELKEDLKRYLDRKPINAKKPTLIKKFSLFIQRNAVPVSVVSIALIAIIFFTILYIKNITEAQKLAQMKEYKAQQTLDFVVEMFELNDPTINQGDSLNVGFLMSEGLAKINTIKDPETKGSILKTLAKVNMSLGNYERSENLYDKAIDIFSNSKNYNEWSESLFQKAFLKKEEHEHEESISLLSVIDNFHQVPTEIQARSNVLRSAIYDLYDADSAIFYKDLALQNLQDPNIDEAIKVVETYNLTDVQIDRLSKEEADSVLNYKYDLIQRFQRAKPNDVSSLAGFYDNLAVNYLSHNEYDSALKYGRLNLSLLTDIFGSDNISVTKGLYRLAQAHGWSGNLDSAYHYASLSIQIKENYFGKDHYSQLDEMSILASKVISNHDFEEGEAMLEKIFNISLNHYGLNNKMTGDHLFKLLQHYNRMGKFEKSAPLYPQLIQVDSSTYGVSSNLGATYADYAWALYESGKIDEAIEQTYRSMKIYENAVGTDNFLFGMALFYLGDYTKEKEPEQAIVYMDSAIHIIERDMPENHPRIGNYKGGYAQLLDQEGYDSLSNIYFTKAIDNYSFNYADSEPNRVAKLNLLYAESLITQNMVDSAKALLRWNYKKLSNEDRFKDLLVKSQDLIAKVK